MALKRTPLKRGTKKLVTHKPLQSKTALRTGKPVNRTSKRKRQQLAAEEDVRALYLINHPRCEIGMAMLASPDPAIRRVYRSIRSEERRVGKEC